MTIGELADKLQAIKDAKSALNEKLKNVNAEQKEVETELIALMDEADINKAGGELCTVTKKVDVRASVADKETFIKWVYENNRLEFIQSRINQAPVKEMLELTNETPPGVDTYIFAKINSRRRS